MGGMIEQKDDMQMDKNEIVAIKDANNNANILGDKNNQQQNNVKRGNEANDNTIRKDTTNAQPMGLDPNA